jgi:hypothetical protein
VDTPKVDLDVVLARTTARRRVLLVTGALAVGAVGGIQGRHVAEARSCRRHNRRCKARCEKRYPSGSLELSLCRSDCGLSCKL